MTRARLVSRTIATIAFGGVVVLGMAPSAAADASTSASVMNFDNPPVGPENFDNPPVAPSNFDIRY